MPTKFWLASSGTPAQAPAYSSYWTIQSANSSIARLNMSTTKGATAQAQAVAWENSATSGVTTLTKQYVSVETIPDARTIDGTVVLDSWHWTNNDSGRAQIVAKVVSGDGATVRGTLIAGWNGSAAVGTSVTRVTWAPQAVTPVAAQAGDRIVVELGASMLNTQTLGRQLNIYHGEAGANAPSVEFSYDIFGAAAVGPTVTWWDGTVRQQADVLGWWDGTQVQGATMLGWWDGTQVRGVV